MEDDYWGAMCIPLTRGKHALIDASDYEMVRPYSWWCTNRGYAASTVNRPQHHVLLMHRIIQNTPPDMMTDHVNLNTLDNRRRNLRVCSNAENTRNRPPKTRSTSQYKGVSRVKGRELWAAAIKVMGKSMWLGTFRNEEDAATAYNFAAAIHHGEYAYFNKAAMPSNLQDGA